MKKYLILLPAFLGLFQGYTQRIIGYYPNYRYSSSGLNNYNNIQYGKLTHLYYFSLNPQRTSTGQSNGALWINDPYSWFTTTRFNNVKNKARSVNPDIKIFLVTGGAPGSDSDLNDRLYYIATNPGILNTFCNNVINFIKTNNLDGWDLDWEFPGESCGTNASCRTPYLNAHEAMLSKMNQKLDSMGTADCKTYEMSIAVGGGYFNTSCYNPAHMNYCNASVINHLDFVNVMTYDAPVGGAPCAYTGHQAYNMMTASVSSWSSTKSWPKSKMNIGVGFYDDNYSTFGAVGSGNFATYYDQTNWGTGGSGCPDMTNKLDYAIIQGYAGVFIWEITQDNLCAGTTPTCYSLLNCIYEHVTNNWGTWSGGGSPCGPSAVDDQQIYPANLIRPNPTEEDFVISLESLTGEAELTVADVTGREKVKLEVVGGTQVRLGEEWPSGVYFGQIRQGQQRQTFKLVKK